MALYGVNAYMSNSYYTSLLSGGNYGSSNKSATAAKSNSDLLSLMQRADQVRSKSYQKEMIEKYRKVFAGEDIGSLESEQNLVDDAKSLNESASALATASLDDISNRETFKKDVETFIDDYNTTIESLKKSDSIDALRKGMYMTNTTKAYARALSRAGIQVGSDNKLTLNEDNFNEATDGALRSLFNGSYSFASKTADKASDISRSAALKAQLTYNSQGFLDYATKQSINSMFSELI
ncbi:MAG: hypothetical protein IJZ72_02460 [Oscillospiraceae bacterium]|nr:hypothetical protein [Oscillospiraceae bacterium]